MKRHFWLMAALALVASPQPSARADVNDLLRGAVIAAQGLFITDAQEIQLGQATAQKILAQTPAVTDPALNAYVNRIGQTIARVSDRPNLTYHFYILNSSEINAFSTPGGWVFINLGCLRFMHNDAQLAGVLGHEIGHVVKRHAVAAIRDQLIAQGLATALLGQNSSQLYDVAANIGATLVLRHYDRAHEYQADQLGAIYAYRANYDPSQLPRFLQALGQAVGETPTWLMPVANHPRSSDRVALLDRLLAQPAFHTRHDLNVGQASFQRNVLARLGAPKR